MGICTSKPKPSPEPNLDSSGETKPAAAQENSDTSENNKDANAKNSGNFNFEEKKRNEENLDVGKKSPFFPFYSPSPAHYLFSKKSPAAARSPAPGSGTPRRFFKLRFAPPSPAKHIKVVLALRHGGAAITEAAGLDKSFGFCKKFYENYEVGEEVGRGHFGYTCRAKLKKGELKGQELAVKVIPKAKDFSLD